MCNFHSVLGIALSDKLEICHLPSNNHVDMAANCGHRGLKNKPNRRPVIFEAEWDGKGPLPPDSVLIRQCDECPERLKNMIRSHYEKLKEALTGGKHLTPDGYFGDTLKYADVWSAAIEAGVPVTLPAVFRGDLDVAGAATLDAPALTEVGGDLVVHDSAHLVALTAVGGDLAVAGAATLDAPALTEVGGYLYVSGKATLAALTAVGGHLDVCGSGQLVAPALTAVGGHLDVYGEAKLAALTAVGGHLSVCGSGHLVAPALTAVGGNLGVSGSGQLDAPALSRVGGYLFLAGSATLDALTAVGGSLSVSGEAKLVAPVLTQVGCKLAVR